MSLWVAQINGQSFRLLSPCPVFLQDGTRLHEGEHPQTPLGREERWPSRSSLASLVEHLNCHSQMSNQWGETGPPWGWSFQWWWLCWMGNSGGWVYAGSQPVQWAWPFVSDLEIPAHIDFFTLTSDPSPGYASTPRFLMHFPRVLRNQEHCLQAIPLACGPSGQLHGVQTPRTIPPRKMTWPGQSKNEKETILHSYH